MIDLDVILDLAAGVCLVLASLLSLGAAVGLLRFPDSLSRLHAGTKPQILGLILVIIAIALATRTWATLLALVPIAIFQLFTAPVAAHMIGRAGYRSKNVRRDLLMRDELVDDVSRAEERDAAAEGQPPAS